MVIPETHELNAEILALLEAPAGGEGAPSLSHLEDTLTTGYARALALEAELVRVDRALIGATPREEIVLRERHERARQELADLRRVLGPLRTRARALRALGV